MRPTALILITLPWITSTTSLAETDPVAIDARIGAIHDRYVFADMHAHPSRFHRSNVESIAAEEVGLYRASLMDLFVANISSDMAFDGRYTNRDGTTVKRGKYKPLAGAVYALTVDRLARIMRTVELGFAVHAGQPADVLAARASGQVAVMPALEGADGLEGRIENLHEIHRMGVRLLQLVHFRNNELGHHQTWPYSPGGLTPFGRQVVAEANRLGIIIDLAHANHQTIMETLELSRHPVLFSHGGVRAYTDHDRAVSDEEIQAIAKSGGVIGIWPHGKHVASVAQMVDYIEHVIKVAGADHVGIGSDLRGVSTYSQGFGDQADFLSVARELIGRGHPDENIGKIMGGNFFRVWQTVVQ